MDVTVTQSGNRIDLAFDGGSMFFEVSGFELPQLVTRDFAVWACLPIAMRRASPLRLDGPVDPVVSENARRMSRIWSMWLPEVYSAVDIEAPSVVPPSAAGDDTVLLYSGGVDSTYALLREHARHPLRHVLTVHGLDYGYNDEAAIADLLAKTDPLLARHGIERIVVRTDAGRHIGQLGLTHAFILSSCLFLLESTHARGFIAADITPEQDFLAFPWGTNHITNPLFAGSHFALHTLSQDVSRIQKLDALQHDPVAMGAISFCAVKAMRPHNCGVCHKCLRTKTMFVALSGECPDIFLSRDITEKQIRALDVSSNAAFKHYSEIRAVARERGFLDRLPGLDAHIESAIAARRRRWKLTRTLRRLHALWTRYRPF